jgi:DNA-directed RNA polymerase specialized sigma24 family protein
MDATAPGADGRLNSFFELPSDDLTVTRQFQRGEEIHLVQRAITELSKDHRQAITLVFFQGKSLREAGEIMDGRSEDAVRMLLRRAEVRLGTILRSTLKPDEPHEEGVSEAPDDSEG